MDETSTHRPITVIIQLASFYTSYKLIISSKHVANLYKKDYSFYNKTAMLDLLFIVFLIH